MNKLVSSTIAVGFSWSILSFPASADLMAYANLLVEGFRVLDSDSETLGAGPGGDFSNLFFARSADMSGDLAGTPGFSNSVPGTVGISIFPRVVYPLPAIATRSWKMHSNCLPAPRAQFTSTPISYFPGLPSWELAWVPLRRLAQSPPPTCPRPPELDLPIPTTECRLVGSSHSFNATVLSLSVVYAPLWRRWQPREKWLPAVQARRRSS